MRCGVRGELVPRSHCCVGCPSDRARRCERRCHRNWWATHNPGALHEGVWFWVKQAQRPMLVLVLILVLMPELVLVLELVLVPMRQALVIRRPVTWRRS